MTEPVSKSTSGKLDSGTEGQGTSQGQFSVQERLLYDTLKAAMSVYPKSKVSRCTLVSAQRTKGKTPKTS